MAIFGTSYKEKSYTKISDYFIALSNETGSLISNLKLQKLVYYADAWHLANYGRPLIQEDFQAWVHGPAIPSLYGEYKQFGWKPIIREDLTQEKLYELLKDFPKPTMDLLNLVTEEYFGLSAFELEKLTHNEEPWLKTRQGLTDDQPSERIIDKNLMRDYYSRFIQNGPKSK